MLTFGRNGSTSSAFSGEVSLKMAYRETDPVHIQQLLLIKRYNFIA